MGFLDKIKEVVGIEEIDEEDDEIVEEKASKSIIPSQRPVSAPGSVSRPAAPAAPVSQAHKPAQPAGRYTTPLKMVVIEPQGFDESSKLVDSLKAKKPVIINLENLETDVARKIFDFLSGATYALNGNVQKVANNIFVFAPENVSVDYNNNVKASERAAENGKSPWR